MKVMFNSASSVHYLISEDVAEYVNMHVNNIWVNLFVHHMFSCTCLHVCIYLYRVAKTHRMPYLDT